ncbi:MAG: hypothetical protein ACK5O2_16030 [Microthrixaceae bacterium]
MKRLLALIGALAMVAAAVLVRGILDNADDPSGGGDSPGPGEQTLNLTCGPALLTVCNALAEANERLAVTEEPEALTTQKLAAGEIDLAGNWAWLAAGDWPAYGQATGETVPELTASSVLARSPAVIVARSDRLAVLEGSCDSVDWACIGDSAGEPWSSIGGEPGWGRIEVGLPIPDDGEGMASVNQAVVSRMGHATFATNDLDDPSTAAWFDRIASESNANAGSTTPLVEFIRRPGSLSVVGAIESEAIRELSGYAGAESLTVIAPEPAATADVRLWTGDTEQMADTLALLEGAGIIDALGAAGWRTPAGSTSNDQDSGAVFVLSTGSASIDTDMRSTEVELPESSGLPTPGVVAAVNAEWESTG